MVTQTNTDVSIPSLSMNRGLIPEETVVAAGPGNTQVVYYRPFWRPVIAGSLFALSVFVLSSYLMFGFHVGITSAGAIALGGGAAVWLWVTACVAFFFGGLIASAMTAAPVGTNGGSYGSAWLKGAVIWGFSIPLSLIILGLLAAGSGLLGSLGLPHIGLAATAQAGVIEPHLGYYWCVFIGLALSLIFSLIGAVAGASHRTAPVA